MFLPKFQPYALGLCYLEMLRPCRLASLDPAVYFALHISCFESPLRKENAIATEFHVCLHSCFYQNSSPMRLAFVIWKCCDHADLHLWIRLFTSPFVFPASNLPFVKKMPSLRNSMFVCIHVSTKIAALCAWPLLFGNVATMPTCIFGSGCLLRPSYFLLRISPS